MERTSEIERGFTLPLQNGEPVDFRPVRPDDRQIIQEGFSALSVKSRYFRFFTPLGKLSGELLRYLTEVDQTSHVAWIALAHDVPEHPGLGIARFIRLKDQPDMAEFAVVVIDRYHQKGLGTFLTAILYRLASIKQIKTLRGYVLPENDVMSHWLGRLGAVGEYENGTYRMDLTVDGDFSGLPDNETGWKFRECLNRLG